MSRIIISERDFRILRFLWRFKFAPTAVIGARYYPGKGKWAAYLRLQRLARAGFIQSLYPASGRHHFWRLDEKGYEIVAAELPPLVQEGYSSENIKHDYLVTAAHLGGWLNSGLANVVCFTEQELRRIDPAHHPSPIPRTANHRPDGYWIISNGLKKSLVALEVELSQKALDLYENVARFYYYDALITQVLWIVKTKEQAKRMLERFGKVTPEGAHVHSFILLSDFLKANWQAKIIIGKSLGHTIQSTLDNMATNRQQQVVDFSFANTRKFPEKSDSKQTQKTLLDFN